MYEYLRSPHTSGCRVQNCRRRWSRAYIFFRLICFDNQAGGDTPPAGNVPEAIFTTPPHATDDASDDPFVKAATKCCACCHGPSCEVADELSHSWIRIEVGPKILRKVDHAQS